jgi:hypothetical protein
VSSAGISSDLEASRIDGGTAKAKRVCGIEGHGHPVFRSASAGRLIEATSLPRNLLAGTGDQPGLPDRPFFSKSFADCRSRGFSNARAIAVCTFV